MVNMGVPICLVPRRYLNARPRAGRLQRTQILQMSFIQLTIKCKKCGHEDNIAEGTFGYGTPAKCFECGYEPPKGEQWFDVIFKRLASERKQTGVFLYQDRL